MTTQNSDEQGSLEQSSLDITLYTPHEKQMEVHNDTHRFKVLNWGRRTGKSTLSCNLVLMAATQVVGRYWIVAPTYKQAKNIYWLDIIHNQIPKELIKKKNEQELIVHLINGSIIELKGADNEDSLRGAGIKGLILDEYAFMKPTVWDIILRPMLADSQGWAVFISTPDGFNHFYELQNYARRTDKEDWWYSHATTYDNPHIPNKEIEDIKSDTTEDQFAQEYMAEFKKMTGLVYKTFERKTHVIPANKVPDLKSCTLNLGIDFGYNNPTGVVFIAIDYDNNWYIYDEIYKSEMVTEQLYNALNAKMGNNFFTNKVGDNQAKQEIANINAPPYNIGVVPCQKVGVGGKSSIQGGIELIQGMLKIQGNGKPKLFISENCENIIYEFETYRYPEKRDNVNAPEDPIKENDHLLDALRYLKLKLYYGTSQLKVYKPQNMLNRKYR